ncbi:MAG: endonuclease VII domain-containing protein, partial [Gammaproteobacteria bacterium]|nr:endonuclease VII domain-containing protein [Gammaproteobacteria bacterium]
KATKTQRSARIRQTLYGITEEQYQEMLKAQDNGCWICGRPPGKKQLFVDHDHQTDKVRGLLCSQCNSAIGFLNDDPALVERALEYLRK